MAWVLSILYLLVEIFTAGAWKTPYSFARDSISSLGVTTCSADSCSPLHDVMNAAFMILGALTILGAALLHKYIPDGRAKKWIMGLAVVVALSTAATGLFPANDGTFVHWTAVLPGFVARHAVLVLLAVSFWNHKRWIAVWSGLCAATGIVGAVLLLARTLTFGLGERLTLYPLPMWMAVTGVAALLALMRRTVLKDVEFRLPGNELISAARSLLPHRSLPTVSTDVLATRVKTSV
ncbi:DUF998 domain-containing protein [Rhodococcus sp. ARC_M6]|uniref:DUF998 domain-containing protein n=1 Tax=Rhodococcus sp. ARC_M6 TaxID=2928852 RepID=UPI001FB4D8F6|nr:DUF998 domain-containing protein [Rhodococcus sp. ARC_M6]MCJ0903264.1 DUF998 domain-containing protein [Rhodococcus sp. ARC_M6]